MITVNKKHVMVHVINTNPEMLPLCSEALRKAEARGFSIQGRGVRQLPQGGGIL